MHLLIRRFHMLIDVSPDGRSPLPAEICALLQPYLQYEHKQILQGNQAWDQSTGRRDPVSIETRFLYRFEQGRLTTGYGFTAKILHVLQSAGHTVHYMDVSPPRSRPDCYMADWINLRANFNPRPRQMDCLEAIANSQGGIINATMAFGKTHIISAVCHLYPRAKIAVLVKPKDVAARIVRQLTAAFPNVGHIGGGQKTYGERITVFTAGSMHYSDGDFDILLCDEAHQLVSEKHGEDLGRSFPSARNYGFTATPTGRLDGAHAKLEMFFGPEIFRLSYQEGEALGLVTPIRVKWLPMTIEDMGGINPALNKYGVPRQRWGLWRNQRRNAMFARYVRENYGPDQQVLMAVATVDHALHLWNEMPEFTLCYSNSESVDWEGYRGSGLIPPSFQPITQQRRDAFRIAFERGDLKKVIATDVWSTGVDFVNLQVLCRLDARQSEILNSQWPGRVSRIAEGKAFGEVVDSADLFDKALHKKAVSRRNVYKSHGWTQEWPQRRCGQV